MGVKGKAMNDNPFPDETYKDQVFKSANMINGVLVRYLFAAYDAQQNNRAG